MLATLLLVIVSASFGAFGMALLVAAGRDHRD